jgi:5'-deoxynucleotidase YfbR-like HD superfamily hydrolase
MSIRDRGVFDLLALSTVNRWGIVDMLRPQSVAEHSYRVWVLVQDLYDVMFPVEHNTFEQRAASDWALTHDAEEVFTGDLPTTVKIILEEICPGITYKLKERVLRDKLPQILNRQRGLEGTLPAYFVKIAETVEAILYLREYGVNMNRKIQVENTLLGTLEAVIKDVAMRYMSLPWDKARDWCEEILRREPTVTIAESAFV